jgi:hypothetical protein
VTADEITVEAAWGELVSGSRSLMSREIREDETGLQATAMESGRPLRVLFIHRSAPASASLQWE